MTRSTTPAPVSSPARHALMTLGRDRLGELTDAFELPVSDRRVTARHVDALLEAERFTAVLEELKRDELKAICEALGLDAGGRAKRPLVERITAAVENPPDADSSDADEEEEAPEDPAARWERLRVSGGNETNGELERRLWGAADELRANSKLKASEYSVPVLGLIFLRYADRKFNAAQEEIEAERAGSRRRRRQVGAIDFQARGVLYLPPKARFRAILELPEGEDVGAAINDAMRAVEEANSSLRGVLPKNYNRLESTTLVELLKLMSSISMDLEGDAFGKIYEYFLGKFAMSEGQKGGEFFTPTSIVRLIVNVIEPFNGRIFDPACGSGGMFVQSARFVAEHKRASRLEKEEGSTEGNEEISVYGQERVLETVRLCQMNLAVHGLEGDVQQGNTYYEDLHRAVGRFDFVMANPPFNVDRVDKDRLAGDARFPFGMPKADNANYLWIQLFYSALGKNGRAGFVMANSASDARGSELEIRRQLIEEHVVDVMVTVGSNFFYTVTLPCTLWFLDRGKKETERRDRVLFLDARHVYRQLDRAHRDFTPEQEEFLANIVRLYRGEETEDLHGGGDLTAAFFPGGSYEDVAGLCKVATVEEIEGQGWSLNAGRYVGVRERVEEDFVFEERLEELYEELEVLNLEGRELEERIAENFSFLVG